MQYNVVRVTISTYFHFHICSNTRIKDIYGQKCTWRMANLIDKICNYNSHLYEGCKVYLTSWNMMRSEKRRVCKTIILLKLHDHASIFSSILLLAVLSTLRCSLLLGGKRSHNFLGNNKRVTCFNSSKIRRMVQLIIGINCTQFFKPQSYISNKPVVKIAVWE